MADNVVGIILDKLSTFLEEEVKLLRGLREDVGSVKDELESMRGFLRDADAKEDDDEEIKVWVNQVREVAHDTEDVLDEFMYRFEQNRRGRGFYGFLCKISRTIKTLQARHQIASELQRIKSRVTDIHPRHQRFNYKLNTIEQGSSSTTPKNTWSERRNDARLLQHDQLVGIDESKEELFTRLLEDQVSSLRVVAVVGMGGLGKTTIVNQIYNDAKVKEHFLQRAWITVSQSFDPCDLLREILQQLFDGIKQPLPQPLKDSSKRSDLSKAVFDFLADKKRYLIVLDDVWDVNAWNDLKLAFPNKNCGSRLMLTTRNVDVASSTTRDFFGGNIYHLKALSSEQSWDLFCARTFQGNSCPPHLLEVSQRIVKRCMGLPLAIVAMSGVLAAKSTYNEWDMVFRGLGAEFESNEKLDSMKKILSLSFNDLHYNLKSCFLYLSMFPEDSVFDRDYIISLWIAEGFVQKIEGRTLEEVGEVYLNQLLNRSLIQVEVDRIYEALRRFKVHDLVREIILLKSKNQNFAAIASEQNPTLLERVRRLSMCTTLENLHGDNNFSRLHTLLFVKPNLSASSISASAFLCGGLRLLKVLDCNGLPLDTFPECITKLYNLRFLCLRKTRIALIPRSIGRLRNLETLDLSFTFVEELPAKILQIHHIRHIKVFQELTRNSTFTKYSSCKVPIGIAMLTCLQSLFIIKASQGHGDDLIRSLGNLKQLRKLGIQELRAEHGPALCSSIEQLHFLRDLFMGTRQEDEILDIHNDISSPPQFLERLVMSGRLKELPCWVHKLSSLVSLVLRWSKLEDDPLESLQALPKLAILEFHDKAYDGEALCFKAKGLQVLKKLTFSNLGRLRRVTVEKGAMPHLQELWVEDCKLLEQVSAGVEFLFNLQNLTFINMGDQLVTRLLPTSQDFEISRVQHVPNVYIGSRNADRLQEKFLEIARKIS